MANSHLKQRRSVVQHLSRSTIFARRSIVANPPSVYHSTGTQASCDGWGRERDVPRSRDKPAASERKRCAAEFTRPPRIDCESGGSVSSLDLDTLRSVVTTKFSLHLPTQLSTTSYIQHNGHLPRTCEDASRRDQAL